MGLSVAQQLAGKGANVIIVARNLETLKEATLQISVCAFDLDIGAGELIFHA